MRRWGWHLHLTGNGQITFPTKCLCGAETKKEFSKTTKKLDAVRRCNKGYECDFIAKEKLKHIVSKEAFDIDEGPQAIAAAVAQIDFDELQKLAEVLEKLLAQKCF